MLSFMSYLDHGVSSGFTVLQQLFKEKLTPTLAKQWDPTQWLSGQKHLPPSLPAQIQSLGPDNKQKELPIF